MKHRLDDLRSVDWDFANAPLRSGIHAIHPYPAKFIPEIPRHLIELFHPGDSSPVLDPFCGCGTTLLTAIEMGLDAWGIDINPLGCLISRVKTTPLPVGLEDVARGVVTRAREQTAVGNVRVPLIPRVDHWFKPGVQMALASLVEHIGQLEDRRIAEALQVALSSIIVRVSNQESDTRYAAVEKDVSAEDVFVQFARAVAAVSRSLANLSDSLFTRLGHATVLNRDTLAVTPQELPSGFGLVVTSPPYPNAYEYWLYHKYRMYWLGMDPLAARSREIGARPKYFGRRHEDNTTLSGRWLSASPSSHGCCGQKAWPVS